MKNVTEWGRCVTLMRVRNIVTQEKSDIEWFRSCEIIDTSTNTVQVLKELVI